ncbi:MAG: hypothetical protein H6621_03020 [Halobacteriovoraceae bacterium]|nr:hypothetical protein [Halobacteriovoraceae bacterium]MCB9094017.1 hypothetical protein [Halobacteriovoraceae bacterium]
MKAIAFFFLFSVSFQGYSQYIPIYRYPKNNQTQEAAIYLNFGFLKKNSFFSPSKDYATLAQSFSENEIAPIPFHNARVDFDYNKIDAYPAEREVLSLEEILSGEQKSSSCEAQCPRNLKILYLNKSHIKPYRENSLSFTNDIRGYRDIENVPTPTYNYCLGHSQATATLRYLSIFDPENALNSTNLAPHSKLWRKLIKERIEKLFKTNEASVFPYVSDLEELSEEFTATIKYYVAWTWFNYTVSYKNLFHSYFNESSFSKNYIDRLLTSLKMRLLSGQLPLIIINPWGDKLGHGLQVYKITHHDGDYTLYVDDSNVSKGDFHDALDFDSQIDISIDPNNPNEYTVLFDEGIRDPEDVGNPKALHGKKVRVGRIDELQFNKDFYARAVESLQRFCQSHCQ